MKRMLVLCVVVCFSMFCSCQKQDSSAETQLAQRRAELDAREKALDDREKALGEWEKAMTKFRAIPSGVPARTPTVDPEEAKAERERRIQQLPPELQALVRDRALLDPRTQKPTSTEDRTAELQRHLEETRRKKMSGIASPNAQTSDAQPSSPSPSPTPE